MHIMVKYYLKIKIILGSTRCFCYYYYCVVVLLCSNCYYFYMLLLIENTSVHVLTRYQYSNEIIHVTMKILHALQI